jgi:uncharacterized SAM-binding protein YcdF (DUF218 family)
MGIRFVAVSIGGMAASVLVFGELAHWRASWRRLGLAQSGNRREAVVVLGYKNKGDRANYLNRYRVRAGIRSLDTDTRDSVLVLCGGTVAGENAEADLMARYAREERGFTGPILLDRTSSSTWENIRNVIPLIEQAESIKVVSNSLHAEKGRAYLWRLRPDLAMRLTHGEDYRIGEITFVKPLAALLGMWNLRSLETDQVSIPTHHRP